MYTCHGVHNETSDQVSGVSFPLQPCGSWELDSGPQACWKAHSPTKSPLQNCKIPSVTTLLPCWRALGTHQASSHPCLFLPVFSPPTLLLMKTTHSFLESFSCWDVTNFYTPRGRLLFEHSSTFFLPSLSKYRNSILVGQLRDHFSDCYCLLNNYVYLFYVNGCSACMFVCVAHVCVWPHACRSQ